MSACNMSGMLFFLACVLRVFICVYKCICIFSCLNQSYARSPTDAGGNDSTPHRNEEAAHRCHVGVSINIIWLRTPTKNRPPVYRNSLVYPLKPSYYTQALVHGPRFLETPMWSSVCPVCCCLGDRSRFPLNLGDFIDRAPRIGPHKL